MSNLLVNVLVCHAQNLPQPLHQMICMNELQSASTSVNTTALTSTHLNRISVPSFVFGLQLVAHTPHVVAPVARIQCMRFILAIVDVRKHVYEGLALHLRGTLDEPEENSATLDVNKILRH